MGETRVDLLHLLEDLRDAYPGAIEETILTETVANSLDSGATCVCLTVDPAQATLTVVDNGSGMRRRELIRYHDLAATTKTHGPANPPCRAPVANRAQGDQCKNIESSLTKNLGTSKEFPSLLSQRQHRFALPQSLGAALTYNLTDA